MKKYFQIFVKNNWHWHSLALLFNFVYFYFGNKYNLMDVKNLQWQGIDGTQYIFQPILSIGATFFVALGVELFQGFSLVQIEQLQNGITTLNPILNLGGIPLGGLYHTSGVVKIRIS